MTFQPRKEFVLLPLLCLLVPACLAQAASSPSQLRAAHEKAQKLYAEKHYLEATALLEPFYDAGQKDFSRDWNSAMYDLACDEALAGNKERAFAVLAASQADGSSVTAEHLAKDTDLASLHDDARFDGLLIQAKQRERLWSHEPGQDAPLTPTLSEDLKVAGLSTVWSEARFNFAFFDRQPTLDWNAAYLEFLPKVRAAASTEEYYRVLMRFVALLRDGHSNAYPPEALADVFYSKPALRTRLLGNDVVVTAIDDPALAAQGWRAGDMLLKLDGEDIRTYATREIAPYQSASTPQDLNVRVYDYGLLGGHADSEVSVTVKDVRGQESVRTLKRVSFWKARKERQAEGATFVLRPDGVAVLTIDEFEDHKGTQLLIEKLVDIQKAKGLIIDVRANGGGDTPADLLQILARSPFAGAMQRTRLYRAVDRARGTLPGWTDIPQYTYEQDATHHVDVPVAVLTSAMTYSAAEDFIAGFDAMHRGITVGEATGGSTGQPLSISLPGGGSARICTKNDRAGDGLIFEGIGLQPTLLVTPTLTDIRTGRDPVMDRAVAALLLKK